MKCTPLLILLFTLLFHATEVVVAQTADASVTDRGYYRTQNSGGVILHSRGMGGFYRRGWRSTGFDNRIIGVELITLRHPKELKFTIVSQNNRGFYYGKLNSVGFLRPYAGWQHTMYDKLVRRGVRVSYYFLVGPTIALVKPVMLDVGVVSSDRSGSHGHVVPATPTIYSSDTAILGRSPMLTGVPFTKVVPSLHVRYILNFEFSASDASIHALEAGVCFDAMAKTIPIMAKTYNDQFFLTLHIGYQFGKRYL